jgi:hypothetical protein
MIPDAALEALAGNNPDALAILEGAYEQLSGPQMDRLLLDHAQPALFAAGQAQRVADAVVPRRLGAERWREWDADPSDRRSFPARRSQRRSWRRCSSW